MYDTEATKLEGPKQPEMVMCGDHPSFTSTKKELNAKEAKDEKEKKSYPRISPASSRTGAGVVGGIGGAVVGAGEMRSRTSEHALRLLEARRHARSLEHLPRTDIESTTGNRALVQAALGSFRWPPYLLAVWVIVLILTHALHCVVTVMERVLPNIKKFCQYFRTWTEDVWKDESEENHRIYPFALALVTGLAYCVYFSLYVLYSVALWSIEPLCTEIEDKQSSTDVMEPKITNYEDEVNSKTNMKH